MVEKDTITKKKSHFWEIFVLCIFILVIIVVGTIAGDFWGKSNSCMSNSNIWCWDDWTCPGVPDCPPGTIAPNCWAGTTFLYNQFSGICNFTNGTVAPPLCTCAWENTPASSVCTTVG